MGSTSKTLLSPLREKTISVNSLPSKLKPFFEWIPSHTLELLWFSNSPPKPPVSYNIKLTINIQSGRFIPSVEQSLEPSLIFIKLPIVKPHEVNKVTPPSYYPSYYDLTPEQRWVYLNWLRDISQPVDISYVFVYYYGLERHLLIGKYEQAVEEILSLMQHHGNPTGTFRGYATGSLLCASLIRNREDMLMKIVDSVQIERNSDLMSWLFLKMHLGKKLKSIEVIKLLQNRLLYAKELKYMNKYEKEYEEILYDVMIEDEQQHGGDILSRFRNEKLPEQEQIVFANYCLPDKIRVQKIPNLISYIPFRASVVQICKVANERMEKYLAKKRATRPITARYKEIL